MVSSIHYSSSNPTSTESSYQINTPYPYSSVEVPIYQASSSKHYNHMINSAYGISGNLAGNISYELFNDNKLLEKITARNIRWIENDSIFRLTDFFKRTFNEELEIIESRRIYDTIFNFNIDDLSYLYHLQQF